MPAQARRESLLTAVKNVPDFNFLLKIFDSFGVVFFEISRCMERSGRIIQSRIGTACSEPRPGHVS